jgi:hypothetical protein
LGVIITIDVDDLRRLATISRIAGRSPALGADLAAPKFERGEAGHRGLARLDDVLRTADRVGRIVGGDDLAGDEPVEQHADGGESAIRKCFEQILQRFWSNMYRSSERMIERYDHKERHKYHGRQDTDH